MFSNANAAGEFTTSKKLKGLKLDYLKWHFSQKNNHGISNKDKVPEECLKSADAKESLVDFRV